MDSLGFGKQVKNSNDTRPLIKDRFEVRNLYLETFSSKLYMGYSNYHSFMILFRSRLIHWKRSID